MEKKTFLKSKYQMQGKTLKAWCHLILCLLYAEIAHARHVSGIMQLRCRWSCGKKRKHDGKGRVEQGFAAVATVLEGQRRRRRGQRGWMEDRKMR